MATSNEQFSVPGQGAGNDIAVGNSLESIDRILNETQDFALDSGNATVTDTPTSSNNSRYGKWRLTGTLTADRELIAPARKWRRWIENATSGSFTVTVVLEAGGSGVEIAAGTAALVECDGTAVTALVVGAASTLAALTDTAITTPTDGQVLVYDAASGKWKNGTATGGSGATAFTGLSDVPAAYTGQASKYVRVKSTADGLEFVTPPAAGATAFTGLSDVPTSYSGAAGRSVRVNAAGTGLEFTPDTFIADLLTTGQETMLRRAATGSASTGTSQLRLSYFTSRKSETVSQIRMIGVTVAGTPTLIRLGLYSEDATTGDLTLIASTANDTTLFASNSTTYTRSFSASVALTERSRYAVGVIVVASSAPSLSGVTGLGNVGGELSLSPRLIGQLSAQTDLPSTVSSSAMVFTSGVFHYAVLLP